ncbi:MAG: ABC transporter substrate-binding protein [Sphingobacteriaceae bacterium]|nr:ABC transporter substrate-binding protein [Sphingobacteriaceae bacterium]
MIRSRNLFQAPRKGIFRACTHTSTFLFGLFTLTFFVGCGESKQPAKSQQHSKRKTFYSKTEIKYAKGFSIEYRDDYKLVRIFNSNAEKRDTVAYALIQRGNAAPKGFDKSHTIEIPLKKLVGMSSLQIAMADFVESPDVIKGLANFKYVTSPKVRANIKAGKVAEVGEEGSINSELIIALNPDLVMAMGNPSASFTRYQTLVDAGVPVLLISEWLENTPLGRAEWVKLMAALVNKEELVNKKFTTIEHEYLRLARLGRKTSNKPGIIVGMPFKGSWFVPDGTSFMTRFFKDAGASYNWYDVKGTGSMGLSFESVAPVALKADYWINSGTAISKADIASRDIRYTYFKPYKNNTIYNFNKKINNLGSNDYWESGVVNPHIILADLIKILHPELLPDYQLVYYKQIL